MANKERVDALLNDIESDISKWDQGTYSSTVSNHPSPDNNFCGAQFCMAGHGALAAGYYPSIEINPDFDANAPVDRYNLPYWLHNLWSREPNQDYYELENSIESMEDLNNADAHFIAQQYLEMTLEEANAIFLGLGTNYQPDEFPDFKAFVYRTLGFSEEVTT
jgi:hypothetical protein